VPGEQLRARFQQTLGVSARRVMFLPWQSLADYYRLLAVADVILDPIHYSAGSSAYDMFSLAQPIVTLPGGLNVARYTQACYRRMELAELVGADREEYVERAMQLGTKSDYREHIRAELRRRSDVLFENPAAADDLQQYLATAVERARS
jgi:predicted O-linked N-acetylglucosamine transferase (SPINDLY family)